MFACVAASRVYVDQKKSIARFEPATESISVKCGNSRAVKLGTPTSISDKISMSLDHRLCCEFRLEGFNNDTVYSGYIAIPASSATVRPDSLLPSRKALLLPHDTLVACLVIGNSCTEAFYAALRPPVEEEVPILPSLRQVMNACNAALAACRSREAGTQTEVDDLRERLEIAEIHLQRVLEARDAEIFDLTFELSKMRVEAERRLAGTTSVLNDIN